jgi:hypothetical protein
MLTVLMSPVLRGANRYPLARLYGSGESARGAVEAATGPVDLPVRLRHGGS